MGFQFDPLNFGLGFGAGVSTAAVGYQTYRFIQSMRPQAADTSNSRQNYAQRALDKRYAADLTAFCERSHIAGQQLSLSQIMVEPRFMPLPPLISRPEEGDEGNIFDIVPRNHDIPFLHAPYNIPTLSIEEIANGSRAIALLGVPGSGRSTALKIIAMWSMGLADFTAPADEVQLQIEKQEQTLSTDQQTERIRDRIRVIEEAREKLLRETGQRLESAESNTDEGGSRTHLFKRMAPLYIHLGNIRMSSGSQLDPAEPLVRALQSQVKRMTARSLPQSTYKLLQTGRAIVLLDGFDEIPETDMPDMLNWLKAFMTMYERNFIVITGLPQGYQRFLDMDFTPVFLRPWDDTSVKQNAQGWLQNHISRSPEAPLAETWLPDRVKYSRALTPLQISLQTWASQAGHQQPYEAHSAMMHYLSQHLHEAEAWLPQIKRLAALELDDGYITAERIIQMEKLESFSYPGAKAKEQQKKKQPSSEINDNPADKPIVAEEVPEEADDEFPDFMQDIQIRRPTVNEEEEFYLYENSPTLEESEPEPASVAAPDPAAPAALSAREQAQLERQISRDMRAMLKTLKNAGILQGFQDGRYRFAHSSITSHFASLTLETLDDNAFIDHAMQASWREACTFAAQHPAVERIIREYLAAPTDILHNNIVELSQYLANADSSNPWRKHLLRLMGNLFISPNQFSSVRERVAAALIASHDEGAVVIFRRALQNPNADLRRIASLCLGVMRDEGAVKALTQLLSDPDEGVQIAATLALGTIGNEDAVLTMVDALQLSPNKGVRRAVSESFATNREEGYLTLYDATESEDIMLRRAAVWGLGRIRTSWSTITLNRIFLDDPEWYVRSAAQSVFIEQYENEQRGVQSYPSVGSVTWLLQWSIEQAQEGNIPHNIGGVHLLAYAIEQMEDPLIRLLAVVTAGQLCIMDVMKELYQRLSDPEDAIRDAAYRAIAEIQFQTGQPLPRPS